MGHWQRECPLNRPQSSQMPTTGPSSNNGRAAASLSARRVHKIGMAAVMNKMSPIGSHSRIGKPAFLQLKVALHEKWLRPLEVSLESTQTREIEGFAQWQPANMTFAVLPPVLEKVTLETLVAIYWQRSRCSGTFGSKVSESEASGPAMLVRAAARITQSSAERRNSRQVAQ
eukprot:5471776-Amphidinium_carterae.2